MIDDDDDDDDGDGGDDDDDDAGIYEYEGEQVLILKGKVIWARLWRLRRKFGQFLWAKWKMKHPSDIEIG